MRVNAIGQSFLHVLDASRFSDNLIEFLNPFKESGLLEQRDLHGRTVLHVRGAIQFALRDNDGLDAAQHIRTIAHAQNPYASYGHVGYAQAIVVYENIANRFIVDTSEPGNAVQEIGANVNNRDRDGNTALYHAIRKGFCDCVAILLQHGAHEHLGASEQNGFDRLQKRLAVVSAIVTYRAALEPTELQARGVDAT
ncbi:hypothetical protein CJF30_00002227 [Rutstroemia sp. NJR-2017a BBW]|nr:hypothetical protein CJF30_00002227 [Rutstroemia sp. NJR-2017a BBW]